MQESDSKPWYKQFWPWFFNTANTVYRHFIDGGIGCEFHGKLDGTNSLVRLMIYYKEGKAINERLDKSKKQGWISIYKIETFSDNFLSLLNFCQVPRKAEMRWSSIFYHVTHS